MNTININCEHIGSSIFEKADMFEEYHISYTCSKCGAELLKYYTEKCYNCGSIIDWNELDKHKKHIEYWENKMFGRKAK